MLSGFRECFRKCCRLSQHLVKAPLLLAYSALVTYKRPDLAKHHTREPQWKQLQSEWRYLPALMVCLGPPNFVLWSVKLPVLGILLISGGLLAANRYGLAISDTHNSLKTAFHLSTFVMSLLLAFRVNRVYDRWWTARSSFGTLGSSSTYIMLHMLTFVQGRPDLLLELARWLVVWQYSLKEAVLGSGHNGLDPPALALLSPTEQQIYKRSRKGRQLVVTRIRQLLAKANLQMHEYLAVENKLQISTAASGQCTRIRYRALPHGLTLLSTGFVLIFLLSLPFAFAPETVYDWLALVVMSTLLLGCDATATALEDPFPFLPLNDLLKSTRRDVFRAIYEYQVLENLNSSRLNEGTTVFSSSKVTHPEHAAAFAVIDEEVEAALGFAAIKNAAGNAAAASTSSHTAVVDHQAIAVPPFVVQQWQSMLCSEGCCTDATACVGNCYGVVPGDSCSSLPFRLTSDSSPYGV